MSNLTWSSFPFLVPGMPNLEPLNSTLTTIVVLWSKPAQPNGKITEYKLCWDSACKTFGPVSMNYTIGDLKPATMYRISIFAFTQIGSGPADSDTITTRRSGMFSAYICYCCVRKVRYKLFCKSNSFIGSRLAHILQIGKNEQNGASFRKDPCS